MAILVSIKQVYGNKTIYPVCESAKIFTELKGQKTLTQKDIELIKKLGYTIKVQPEITEL